MCDHANNLFEITIFFAPIPYEGEELYTQMGFFQIIFADRYRHRRELRLVSIESSSSVEYEIKKIFFSFFTGSYRGLNFWEK